MHTYYLRAHVSIYLLGAVPVWVRSFSYVLTGCVRICACLVLAWAKLVWANIRHEYRLTSEVRVASHNPIGHAKCKIY